MNNPVFRLAAADPAVTALLGDSPVRFYPFGEAEEHTPVPYAVWQTVYGTPENLLAGRPLEDSWGTQIDCYALTVQEVSEIARALQTALELEGYVVSYNGEFREPDTRLYRSSFTVEFIEPR